VKWRVLLFLALSAALSLGERLEPGARAPGFSLLGLDGEAVKYEPPAKGAATPGSPLVYVLFVLPGQEISGEALHEMAVVLKEARAWPRKVRAIAVAGGRLDDASLAALRAAAGKNRGIVMAHDGKDVATRAYGVIALPTTFVIAPDGRIAAVLPGRSSAYRKRLRVASLRALGIKVSAREQKSPQAIRAERHAQTAEQLVSRGRYAQAAEELERACSIFPKAPDLWIRLGEVLLLVPDAKAAADRFQRALALAPKHKRALRGVAKAHALYGEDFEEVEDQLKKQLRRPPNDPGLRFYLGRLYERQGRIKDAMTAYRKAFEDLRRAALRGGVSR